MNIKLLIEHHLEFLSLKGGCTDTSEYTLVKIPHCWKSHTAAQMHLIDEQVIMKLSFFIYQSKHMFDLLIDNALATQWWAWRKKIIGGSVPDTCLWLNLSFFFSSDYQWVVSPFLSFIKVWKLNEIVSLWWYIAEIVSLWWYIAEIVSLRWYISIAWKHTCDIFVL